MSGLYLYNTIVISDEPRGRFFNGVVYGALTPGIVVQIKPAVEKVNGQFTYYPYQPGADGQRPYGPIIVLCEDRLRGKGVSDAYADGDIGTFYIPIPGDELLMVMADVAGTTSDTHAIGDPLMIDHTTGTLLAPSSEECQPFVCLETLAGLSANQLTHCMFSAY